MNRPRHIHGPPANFAGGKIENILNPRSAGAPAAADAGNGAQTVEMIC